MQAKFLAAFGAILLASPAAAVELDFGVVKTLEHLSLPVPSASRPIVCHGFGCAYQTPIVLRPNDQKQIKKLLGGPAAKSPDAERKALAATMAWFEKRVAPEAGTGKAKARAGFGSAGDPSQFDCMDKTHNTIELLWLVTQMGLLRHHAIDVPESRGGLGSLPHTTAVVRERTSGQKWVIDGWTRNNGELPDIMPLETWKIKS